MTTHIDVTCNGNYVAEVRQDGREPVLVGPGSLVKKTFSYPHPGPSTLVITERPATPEEIEASQKTKTA